MRIERRVFCLVMANVAQAFLPAAGILAGSEYAGWKPDGRENCLPYMSRSAAFPKDDDDAPEKVYELGPGMTPPKVVKQVPPRQSTAHGVRIVGTVTVVLVVSSKGLPKDIHVIKGLDKELDQSTVEAVAQWQFEPAKKDGKPVAVRVSLDIAFHDM